MLSFRSEVREGPGSEPAHVHLTIWRRGSGVADGSARAAAGDAGDWISQQRIAWQLRADGGRIPQGLKEAGYVEGQNVAVEYRWAEGQYDRVPVIALELVDRRVAVLVANTPGVLAVKAAITTTPIVFTTASDPVQIGLVASMSRPSGNVTGATTMGVELASKLLELAHELVPTASVIAALINPANSSAEPHIEGPAGSGTYARGTAPRRACQRRARFRYGLCEPGRAEARRACDRQRWFLH